MPRGKKEKQEPEPVEELKDAAEEVTLAVAAVAVDEPEPKELEVAEDDKTTKTGDRKRKAEQEPEPEEVEHGEDAKEAKRNKTIDAALIAEALAGDDANVNTALVQPDKDGQENFTEQDVLLGRGGGTVCD